MPPRNPELPEGTDHIINGAMETGAGTTGSTGSGGAADEGSGGSAAGFIGAGETGDDTGGTAIGAGAPLGQQVRDQAQSLKQQAGDRLRGYAEDGKGRATTALDDLSRMINDAATSIDEKLGGDYGQYARRAADTVSGISDRIRDKDVDALFEDARDLVRKSPGIAIGAAALVGFTLVRLVKAGVPADKGGSGEGAVQFTSEAGRGIEFEPEGGVSTRGAGA